MSRGQASLEELVHAAVLIVAIIGFSAFFLLTDFNSIEQSSDNLTRFIWALVHMAFPTSRFAVYIELALGVVGGFTIGRTDARVAIVTGFVLYLLINFIDAWFAAPV